MPTATQNKVKYNLKNVHYAELLSEGENGPTYGPIKAWPGAVSANFEAQGETNTFYADGIKYYISNANNGYDGDFESALVPEDFKKTIYGFTADTDNVLMENADAPTKYFALLFEFDGDANARKHVLYKCTATRPNISSKTKEATIDPSTETVKITASSVKINGVNIPKAETCSETSAEAANAWYQSVHGAAQGV